MDIRLHGKRESSLRRELLRLLMSQTSNKELTLALSGWLEAITGSLKVAEEGRGGRVRESLEDGTLVVLKTEEGAASQGVRAACRSC